jgi:excisionase family DNA binding protein
MTVCLMFQIPPQRRLDLTGPTRSSKRPRTSDLPAWVLAAPKQVEGTRADKVVPLIADDLLTVAEVAQYMRVSTRTVSRMTKSGRLPAKRVGRAVRIERSLLMTTLAALPQISGETGSSRE